jgi:hypothetical protein
VPTLADLLEPDHERPKVFSLQRAGERERFDEDRIGLTVPTSASQLALLAQKARSGARDIYITDRIGHSNQGHNFAGELSASQKTALLEYLKTL